jgi:hypothetical protein
MDFRPMEVSTLQYKAVQGGLRHAKEYLRKHQLFPSRIHDPADEGLGIVVVIPCHDEADVVDTLESLWRAVRPRSAVELLLVVNGSEDDDHGVRARNADTVECVTAWGQRRGDRRLALRVLDFPDLPRKHAGVGLARKLGMDEAVMRFVHAHNPLGIIASLDADCRCDENYFEALEQHFHAHPDTRACSIYFEHDMDGADGALATAITEYELFLRYYRHGLRFAGMPFAKYTVGSSMAVRCDHYARHGGMNRRKAGEDFYFLNKLMAVGGVSELTATRVIPGLRPSLRTPFGTGRALARRLAEPRGPWMAYAPEVFRDLAGLGERVDGLYDVSPGDPRALAGLAQSMIAFLTECDFAARHVEMRANSASRAAFRKRFFRWFDGFRALKFIHHGSEHRYPRVPLEQACLTLLRWQGCAGELSAAAGCVDLLRYLRRRDRQGSAATPAPRAREALLDRQGVGVRLTAGSE